MFKREILYLGVAIPYIEQCSEFVSLMSFKYLQMVISEKIFNFLINDKFYTDYPDLLPFYRA